MGLLCGRMLLLYQAMWKGRKPNFSIAACEYSGLCLQSTNHHGSANPCTTTVQLVLGSMPSQPLSSVYELEIFLAFALVILKVLQNAMEVFSDSFIVLFTRAGRQVLFARQMESLHREAA